MSFRRSSLWRLLVTTSFFGLLLLFPKSSIFAADAAGASLTFATPELSSVTPSGGDFILSWSQPSSTAGYPDGGFDIIIDGVDTNQTYRTTGTTATISGLSAGEHCFQVQARWDGGQHYRNSTAICASSGEALPDYATPVLESVTPSGSDFILTWTQPTSSAGAPDGGFDLLIDGVDTNLTHRTSGTTITVSGLSSGEHCFQVQARWDGGQHYRNSTAICASSAEALPDYATPVLESVTPSGSDFILTWTQPASSAGAPDGGFDLLIDGVDTNLTHRTSGTTTTVSSLIAGEHCFQVQARWDGGKHYRNSTSLCATGGVEAVPNIPVNDTTVNYEADLPVSLVVDNKVGVDRHQEPVTSGVPLPESAGVTDVEQLVLTDGSGQVVPAQLQVQSRWRGTVNDMSKPIKWLLVDFQADVLASGQSTYYLGLGDSGAAPTHAVQVTEGSEAILVDTGQARFEISRKHFNLFDRVWVTGGTAERLLVDQVGKGGVTLVDKNGKTFNSVSAAPEEIVLEEQGPLRTVVKIRGNLRGADGSWFAPSVNNSAEYPRFSQPYANSFVYYNCRIHFYAGKNYVKVFFTLENNGANGRTNPEQYFAPVQVAYFDSMTLNLGLESLGAGQLSTDGIELAVGEQELVSVFQSWRETSSGTKYGTRVKSFADGPFFDVEKDGGVLTSGKTHSGRLEYAGSQGRVSFAMRHFWQNYPKRLEVASDKLEIGLWPQGEYFPNCNSADYPNHPMYCAEAGQDAGIYLFDAGRHKTFEMVLGFHADGQSPAAGEAELTLNQPLMALAAPEWFVETGALGMLAPGGMAAADAQLDEAMQRFDQLQAAHVDDYYAEVPWTIATLKTEDPSFWNYTRQDRFFGWANFGDLLWSGQSPSALHYDWPYSMMLHYIRTGKRDFFDRGVEMARHRYDIDQYHGERKDSKKNHRFLNHLSFYENDGHGDPTLDSKNTSRIAPPSHTWNGGLVLYYLLTGDKKAWEAALENGKAALAYYGGWANSENCAQSELRLETWPMLNLLNLYRVDGDPEHYRVAKNIAMNRLLYREQQAGGIGHFGRGDGCSNIDTGQQESTMYGYAIDPIIQAQYDTQDPELGNMLLRMADFTKNTFLVGGDYDSQGLYRPLQSTYIWKAGHTGGEPVKNVFWADLFAYAYQLSGDPEYLEWARQTFRDAMFYYSAKGRSYIEPTWRARIGFLDGMFNGSETKVHGWLGRTNQVYLNTEYSLLK